jgi:hypothetical protein
MNEIIAKFSAFNSQEFIFLVLATILFFDVIYFLWNFLGTRSFIKNSAKASAVIVEAKAVQGEKDTYQELTLIFKDDSGMEFSPMIENRFKFRYRGERVEVFYSKKDPSNVVIDDWRALHMKSFVSFFAAVTTVGIGYYMLLNGLMKIVIFW